MKPVLEITKALADETRLRALLALRGGELCLCHLVALFELAPSTMSRHMDLLWRAGLVTRRKEGRWAYFRLARREASTAVREALHWVLAALADDPRIVADAERIGELRQKDISELTICYRC